MSMIITNIKSLVGIREKSNLLRGTELAELPSLEDAFLKIEGDEIAGYGKMQDLNISDLAIKNIDASGTMVLPAWCDSHTHLVFGGSREGEFVDKLKGFSYSEINEKGGGILNSARKLNEIAADELYRLALTRLEEVSQLGTGAIEIKSGYGLSPEGELKMLRVIDRLKKNSRITIKSTFLAHTYPLVYRDNHKAYIDLIINEMLPVIAKEKLADYIDVFCEKGFFSVEEMEMICRAGLSYGLRPKLHVNQLHSLGGVQSGLKLNAVSLDHLENLSDEEIALLGRSNSPSSSAKAWKGVATLLPTAAFFLRMPFQPARRLIEGGAAIAIATDYNPGSSPSGNMNFVISLSCIQMRMLPEEAINAATLNGAYAMGIEEELGSITIGKKANLIFTRPIPSLAYLPYTFGNNQIDKVMIKGAFI